MGDTKIQWTNKTWNPVTGCQKISQGCKNCWANQIHDMRHNAFIAGKKMPQQYAEPFTVVQTHADRLRQPLKWKKPSKIAVVLGGDLFNDDVPDGFIAKVFAVMEQSRRHTFQILTKRPERMSSLLNSHEFVLMVDRSLRDDHGRTEPSASLGIWPLRNVWIGVSVEDQKTANSRIPLLLKVPAVVHWVSAEPLLAPVKFESKWLCAQMAISRSNGDGTYNHGPMKSEVLEMITQLGRQAWKQSGGALVDWIVVGGESGPGARPMLSTWADSIRQECVESGVAFFYKQTGEWVDAGHPLFGKGKYKEVAHIDSQGNVLNPAPESEDADCNTVVRVGKRRAGRELYGVTYDEYPA